MPYCKECGAELEEDATYCSNCGAPVAEETESSRPRRKKDYGTSLDMEENIEAVLTYVLGWITGIVFWVIENKNEYVRFHAMQSILTFFPLTVLVFILNMAGGGIWWAYGAGAAILALTSLVGLLTFVLWIILMLKAYKGERYKLPVVGDIAEDQLRH